MSKPTTYKFAEFWIQVGNGASPEVFSQPCGFTSKSFTLTAATNDTNVPDCDDPDAPAWLERDVVSISRDFNGSGILAKEAVNTWEDWADTAASKNCKIIMGDPMGSHHLWEGAYLLTSLGYAGEKGNKGQVSVTLTSDGEIVHTDNT